MAKRFLTLDEIAANAMTIVPNATSEERNIFKQWAWLGFLDLGPTVDHLKVAEIIPVDFAIEKPTDYVMAADLALFDENENEVYFKFRRGVERIHQDLCEDLHNNVEVSEDQLNFYMSSNATNVASVKLRYFAQPLDEDGQPMVPNTALIALMAYIRYMWELRQGDNRLMSNQLEEKWVRERERCRGRFRNTNMLVGKQIAKEWMSMIGKTYFERY